MPLHHVQRLVQRFLASQEHLVDVSAGDGIFLPLNGVELRQLLPKGLTTTSQHLSGILGCVRHIADFGLDLLRVTRDLKPFARERVADFLNAVTEQSGLPEGDDVDALVTFVNLTVLVSDLLVEHKSLSFSGPEDEPLKPLEVVLVDDASNDLKVAFKARLLDYSRHESLLVRVRLQVNCRPLLVHLESLLQCWQLRSGHFENGLAISKADDTLFRTFDLFDLLANEFLLLSDLRLNVLLQQIDVLVLSAGQFLQKVREVLGVSRYGERDVVAAAHFHEVSQTALRLLTLSNFLRVW